MSVPAPLPTPNVDGPEGVTSGGQFLALIVRFFVGYGVLFACTLLLLRRPPWTLSAVDVLFWSALALILVLHRLSVTGADGIAKWRRAALGHVIVVGLVWLACQLVHVR